MGAQRSAEAVPSESAAKAFVFTFAGGSELSTESRLFIAATPVVSAAESNQDGICVATLALHGEIDPCTIATTRVLWSDQEEPVLCSYHSQNVPQTDGVPNFLTTLAGFVDTPEPPRSGPALLHLLQSMALACNADAAARNDSSALHNVVCTDTRFSTGPKVWPAAVGLCNHLASSALVDRLRGASVLELGCGLGLPGAVALKMGARRALLTDCGADVAKVAQASLESGIFGDLRSCLNYQSLPWGVQPAEELLLREGVFDVVLCCDCVYEIFFGEESWQVLSDTIAVFLAAPASSGCGVAPPLAVLSVERRIKGLDGVDSFLEALQAHNLHVDCVVAPVLAEDSRCVDGEGVEIWHVTRAATAVEAPVPESSSLASE